MQAAEFMNAKLTTVLRVGWPGLAASALPTGCASLPQDDAGATVKRFENLRATRYTEIFLIGGNAITRNFKAGVYNTIGLNDYGRTGDSSPDERLAKIDLDALKNQYEVLGTFKNGPRLWTLDWIDVPVGVERDFNGLKAVWVGRLTLPKGVNLKEKGSTAYKPTTIERKTQFGFSKGKPVFILDDPEGKTWVMKSCGLIVDPVMICEKLMMLGEKLKPASGWKYRVQALDRDLVLKPESGVAGMVQDEFGNTYDLTGEGYSNFKP